jgi:hypothetical protein
VEDLPVQKNAYPVLGFRGKLYGGNPENPLLFHRLGMLNGKYINPAASFFKLGF